MAKNLANVNSLLFFQFPFEQNNKKKAKTQECCN